MRLKHKRQVLELISTINDGLNYAMRYTKDMNNNHMLNDCIEGLLFLKDLLKDENNVRDILYRVIYSIESIDLNKMDTSLGLYKPSIEEARSLLKDLKYSIKNDVSTEFEIVFMPYKASMWDSLESIYKEAVKDPSCTCYVVPIPYYERNSNGEFDKFCYEGNQFPKDVNVTLFETYNLEKRQPDIIYIHNPYDKFNYLTTVNPRYYSEELAQYTNMLVYVPYYIAGSSETKEFKLLPSYKNMTKIITQSNNSKEAFIMSGLDSSKILSLGSPKLDAMIFSIKEKKKPPLSWTEIVSNKKTILFNTGITNLLEDAVKWIEQIKQILNDFISNDKCAFIWRPHPLTEITIKTMRQNVLEEFEIIMGKVKSAPNIIIDETNDIYSAATISDGLISDYSSIMMQYIITEKPILGMLPEDKLEKNRYYLADYLGCYFIKEMSVNDFIEVIVKNKDYQRESRVSKFKKSVNNPDGTCGLKIHNEIKKEVSNQLR